MTEQDAVERVSDAVWDELGYAAWESDGTLTITEDDWPAIATAAITAYNAWLRERAQDADVVEAVMQAQYEGDAYAWSIQNGGIAASTWAALSPDHQEGYRDSASIALTAALDAMIGKEQADDSQSTDTTR